MLRKFMRAGEGMQIARSLGSRAWDACAVEKGEEAHANWFPRMTFLPHRKSK